MDYEDYNTDTSKRIAPPLPIKDFTHAPPEYTDVTSLASSNRSESGNGSSKGRADQIGLGATPWLLRRTSIHVSSEAAEPLDNDRGSTSQLSIATSKWSDKESGFRKRLFKQGRLKNQGSLNDDSAVSPWQPSSASNTEFGTKVSIEAGRPNKTKAQRHYDMKGLEQAASVKRWGGGGKPGEAWGKLQKDPELWIPNGDVLVYFGYQRPTPSFRINSSVLEDIGSEILTSKLHEGLQQPTRNETSTTRLEHGLGNMTMSRSSHPRTNRTTTTSSHDATEAPVRYHIHFPGPDGAAGQGLLRYHLTTRNFFAFLLNRPLVGLTFYQALIDLHQRLQLYLPGDPNCALVMIRCLMENNLHNVCGDPAAAAGLLAWSEEEEICWQEGWREGFVHCSGMYEQLRPLPEFRDVSYTSRMLLERAHLERQVRVQEAEDHLSTFDFNSIWTADTYHLKLIRTAFDQMRKFLREYYQKAYRTWPPNSDKGGEDAWLTRTIVARLQLDFDRLYDYLVDTDIVWSSLMFPQDPSTGLVCRKSNSKAHAEDDNFLAEWLKRIDKKHKYTSIPHPYPLLPPPAATNDTAKQTKGSLFSSKSKTLEKRAALAYSEASNILKAQKKPDFAANGLVDAFIKFEHSDQPTAAEPRNARKGRWMLLYCILQALGRISVDTPDLYFVGDVNYFLNPRLKGTPPWISGRAEGNVYEEAQVKFAHCWRDFQV